MKIKCFLLFLSISITLSAQTLVAEYDFTGATGTDNSTNNYTGVIFGSSTTGNELVIGSNTSDYFKIPPATINGRLAFSTTFRVNFTGLNVTGNFAANQFIQGDDNLTEGSFALSYQHSVHLWRFSFNGSLHDFPDTCATSQWYCVTLTRNATGNIKLYVDGIQNPVIYNDTSTISVTSLLLGQEDDCTGGCFDANQCGYCKIDDFRIYSDAIGQASSVPVCPKLITAINELSWSEADQGKVFPNPATTLLTLELKTFSEITIIDGLGNIVRTIPFTGSNSVTIDVHDLAAGVYFISSSSGLKSKFVKIN